LQRQLVKDAGIRRKRYKGSWLTHFIAKLSLWNEWLKSWQENTGSWRGNLENTGTESQSCKLAQKKRLQTSTAETCAYSQSKRKLRPLGFQPWRIEQCRRYICLLYNHCWNHADHNSHGFRPDRACRDAVAQCFNTLARRTSAQWVLDADISGCFDQINHDWLLANIPMDKAILHKWLKSVLLKEGVGFQR